MKKIALNSLAEKLKNQTTKELVIVYVDMMWHIYDNNSQFLAKAKNLDNAFLSAIKPDKKQQKKLAVKKEIVNSFTKADHYIVYADGSVIGNGTDDSSAAGTSLIHNDKNQYLLIGEYLGTGTNNQAEIIGACLGLEAIQSPSNITLYSDSQYVIKTMTGKYRKSKNQEFWKRLTVAVNFHKSVDFQWIKGHNGNILHDLCDSAAYNISTNKKIDNKFLNKLLS